MKPRDRIAKNVALMLRDNDIVNLGLGIPSLVTKYIPEDKHIFLHNENGSLGIAGIVQAEDPRYDPELIDASANCGFFQPGGSVMDSLTSFAFVRSGRLNVTVLGAMEVDEHGDLANWSVPGKMLAGMGGAMDLVSGAQKVIVAMEHCSKLGKPKILHQCTLPLTAKNVCSVIVTELAILAVTPQGLELTAKAPGVEIAEIVEKTEARLILPDCIAVMVDE